MKITQAITIFHGALILKKKELAELVIGAGDESIAKELTKEDLKFLFSF